MQNTLRLQGVFRVSKKPQTVKRKFNDLQLFYILSYIKLQNCFIH